jgi:hypothetical protein
MNLPDGWTEAHDDEEGGWSRDGHDARAYIDDDSGKPWAAIAGYSRATKDEAERDLERMVWALEGADIAMVKADRDKALTRITAIETWNAALAEEVEKAQHQAHLTEQALTAARAEIADLRAASERRDARERARHPVVRRIAHALYVRRGVE